MPEPGKFRARTNRRATWRLHAAGSVDGACIRTCYPRGGHRRDGMNPGGRGFGRERKRDDCPEGIMRIHLSKHRAALTCALAFIATQAAAQSASVASPQEQVLVTASRLGAIRSDLLG